MQKMITPKVAFPYTLLHAVTDKEPVVETAVGLR